MKEFSYGDSVRCTGTFRNADGVVADPTSARFSYKYPDGTLVTKIYPSDPEVVKVSTGIYYIDIDANTPGTWYWRAWSTGIGKAAEEGSFKVKSSQFD